MNKKKSKPIKIKDEYNDIENKLNENIFSSKSKIPTKRKLSLTSNKKLKNNSLNKSQINNPKRLFRNNSLLPLIQNK